MSKQEVKKYKQMEEIRDKIKNQAETKEISMRRMLKDVPQADVVITNPTHYAVAIKYDTNKMSAPYVLAKGVDFMAIRIKEVAKENKVYIMENVALARHCTIQ